MQMLKACSRCGRIHAGKCQRKEVKAEYSSESKFRNTWEWQRTRNMVKERDRHLCQLCIRNLYNTVKTYTYDNLSVHHIIPLAEDRGQATNPDYLITLCRYHHGLADAGEVKREVLLSIVKEQSPPL